METHDIPEGDWTTYFAHLNHDLTGWIATIEVLDGEFGPQHIATDLPFLGISFDTKGSRANSVQISAGDRSGDHINHVMDLPLHIREADETDGSIDVQIELARGPVTLIHLHDPVH